MVCGGDGVRCVSIPLCAWRVDLLDVGLVGVVGVKVVTDGILVTGWGTWIGVCVVALFA